MGGSERDVHTSNEVTTRWHVSDGDLSRTQEGGGGDLNEHLKLAAWVACMKHRVQVWKSPRGLSEPHISEQPSPQLLPPLACPAASRNACGPLHEDAHCANCTSRSEHPNHCHTHAHPTGILIDNVGRRWGRHGGGQNP